MSYVAADYGVDGVAVSVSRSPIARELEVVVRLKPPEMMRVTISEAALEDSIDAGSLVQQRIIDMRDALEGAVLERLFERFVSGAVLPAIPTTCERAAAYEFMACRLADLAKRSGLLL